MRVLFLSGVDVGGAPKSTLELARLLADRGHSVGVLLGQTTVPPTAYDTLLKAAIKLREHAGWGWPRHALSPFGSRITEDANAGPVRIWRAKRPENALRRVLNIFGADVVVANSFPREALRWISEELRPREIPLCLYMREDHSVTHLSVTRLPLALVLANSRRLADAASVAGYDAVLAPSIIDLAASAVSSTRDCLLLVNPVPENRPEMVRLLASERPDIRCVLQESWPLPEAQRETLTAWATELGNLEFRTRTENPAHVYRDARILLATYPSGRPRVVLEAQANGIPVIALDQPALRETVGPGGLFVDRTRSDAGWCHQVQLLWDDTQWYESLSRESQAHARRAEVQPTTIVTTIERELRRITG